MQLQSIIHYVDHKQLETEYPESQAAIIGTGAHKPIIDALCQLHIHQHKTPIIYTECNENNATELIEKCATRNITAIIIGNARHIPGNNSFSAAVVAPSANVKSQETYRNILEHSLLDLFSIIGFQTYHTSADDILWLQERYYETLRLGTFRENTALAEPLLRESNHVFFDLNALRACDAPETRQPTPNGLYAEEMCQLAAFAGRATQLNTFRLFGYIPTLTPHTQTAQIAAQVLWHLLESLAIRNQLNLSGQSADHIQKIIVDMGENSQTLEFQHNTITHQWWLQIPLTNGTTRKISCLRDDYEYACRREVPIRWLQYFHKFNQK